MAMQMIVVNAATNNSQNLAESCLESSMFVGIWMLVMLSTRRRQYSVDIVAFRNGVAMIVGRASWNAMAEEVAENNDRAQ